MIYNLAKSFISIAVRQFFSSVSISGEKPVENGPLLVVANHPNCALDPILAGYCFERPLWYMAKSTLFKGPLVSALLSSLHMLPIYRRQDSSDGSASNEGSFKAATERLRAGSAVAIFPEGTSLGERRLAPLKTGTARIAFQAEAEADFALGLRIQPLGITYTDMGKFRSSVALKVGEPIPVADYRTRYLESAQDAVRELTDEIERRLKGVTVEVAEAAHDDLVEMIGKLYQSRGRGADDFERLNAIARNVEKLGPALPEKRTELETRLQEYLSLLDVFNLDESGLTKRSDARSLLLALPVAFGLATSFAPYKLTAKVTAALSSHPATEASYKLGSGMLLFSLWYVGLALAIGSWIGSIPAGVTAFLALLGGGYLANNHSDRVRLFVLSRLWPGRRNPLEVVQIIGDSLIGEMEALRVE